MPRRHIGVRGYTVVAVLMPLVLISVKDIGIFHGVVVGITGCGKLDGKGGLIVEQFHPVCIFQCPFVYRRTVCPQVFVGHLHAHDIGVMPCFPRMSHLLRVEGEQPLSGA